MNKPSFFLNLKSKTIWFKGLSFVIGAFSMAILAGSSAPIRLPYSLAPTLSLLPQPKPISSTLASNSTQVSASTLMLQNITTSSNTEYTVRQLSETAQHKISIPKSARVFLFGDSMVHAGLSARLGTLVKKQGGSLDSNAWVSSSTLMWSTSDRLSNLLLNYKPDFVFIVLGSNEVMLSKPEARALHVQKIVKQLQGRPCVWVGPPIWKHETGIVSVLEKNSTPCLFFNSSQLKIERQRDGIHPTAKGGSDWADAIWSQLIE